MLAGSSLDRAKPEVGMMARQLHLQQHETVPNLARPRCRSSHGRMRCTPLLAPGRLWPTPPCCRGAGTRRFSSSAARGRDKSTRHAWRTRSLLPRRHPSLWSNRCGPPPDGYTAPRAVQPSAAVRCRAVQANGSSGHAPPGPSEKQAYQVVPAQADTVLLLPAVQPGAASNGAAPESSDAPAQRHHAHRRRRGGAGGRAQDARQAAGGSAGAQQQQAEQEQQAEDLDVSMGRAGADEGSGEDEDEHPRHFWSRQLQQPEWMTAVPPDLASQWLVMPRPQGPRVVVATGRCGPRQ